MANIYISGEIESNLIREIIEAQTTSGKNDIDIYINSGGGCADTGLAIHDHIKDDPRVATHIVGRCSSSASVIFLGGSRARTSVSMPRMILHKGMRVQLNHVNTSDLAYATEQLEPLDRFLEELYRPYLSKKQMKAFLAGEDVSVSRKDMVKRGMLK